MMGTARTDADCSVDEERKLEEEDAAGVACALCAFGLRWRDLIALWGLLTRCHCACSCEGGSWMRGVRLTWVSGAF